MYQSICASDLGTRGGSDLGRKGTVMVVWLLGSGCGCGSGG